MKRFKCFWGLLIAIIFSAGTVGAQAQVSVFVPDTVRQIGDELSLIFSYTSSSPTPVRFPQINPDDFPGLEFFPVMPKSDTISKNGSVSQQITYKFAVYEDGEYTVPPQPFYINPSSPDGQILYSDTFRFTVTLPVVDTTIDIRDIAPVEKVSIIERFNEWVKANWTWLIAVIVLLALIALGIVYYLKRKKDEPLFLRPRKPALSPRETALRALKELHEKKLWQQNAVKEYYTFLTDILRQYLVARYDISALEMTSNELLDAFASRFPENKSTVNDFRFVLTNSDLAKFAKSAPMPADNEMCYAHVLRYIEGEIEIPVVDNADDKAKAQEEVQSQENTQPRDKAQSQDEQSTKEEKEVEV
ncbi:MAG: BatD family protein [Bacteroidales bacterium]|jgi:hypothetical protein|nr:BatD family protein [Bacteroidales bacterium]